MRYRVVILLLLVTQARYKAYITVLINQLLQNA